MKARLGLIVFPQEVVGEVEALGSVGSGGRFSRMVDCVTVGKLVAFLGSLSLLWQVKLYR